MTMPRPKKRGTPGKASRAATLKELPRYPASKHGHVAVTSLPSIEGRKKEIQLTRLKPLHRGFQYAGAIKTVQVTINAYPAAHAGSPNAAVESGKSFITFPVFTPFSVWTELVGGRLKTFFEWGAGELSFETRLIKTILVSNKEGKTVRVPTHICWYVLDAANQVVKYD